MGARGEDREPEEAPPVHPGGGEERAPVLLDGAREPVVPLVGVGASGRRAEDHDREVRLRTDLEPRDLQQLLVRVAREEELLLERRLEGARPEEEEREPDPEPAEGARELRREL